MEWSIFALLQMFIITIAVSMAFWLRMRGIQQQNDALRLHIENLASAPTPPENASPTEWIQQQIDALDAAQPSSAIVSVALSNLLEPTDNFEQVLTDAILASSMLGDSDRVQELEAELEALSNKLDSESASPGESVDDRNEELKTLLQQFTKDSREMMLCIQTLEAENAQLREQLGLDAETATADSSSTEEATDEAAPTTEQTAAEDTAAENAA
jgi:hypothetical protein